MGMWQTVLDTVYPPSCAMCDAETDMSGGLCGSCWRQTRFVTGCRCRLCGAPQPGEDDDEVTCDDCLVVPRPWSAGTAALVYSGLGRGFVLKLKHADRLDLLAPAASWMARAGAEIWPDAPCLIPVPTHWRKRLKRRYDQAALLARATARATGHEVAPRALFRTKPTAVLDGMGVDARMETLENVIAPHPRFGVALAGRNVVLIDDVMTSGASFSAAARAARRAGAADVRVLALARVVKDA